ncbi:uncharacterized protein LOC142349005 [Convolutriloba macropyga]|uniref:uncharacterized protein LOC142349005 n=1 Tax=Convolutriloba macropyga TaxID=536237 RepID=UPI003F51EBA7
MAVATMNRLAIFRLVMSNNPFEGDWKPPAIKLPEDKTYLQPAKAFAHPGCWTQEELEERYWNRRFAREQTLSPREPIEFVPKYTPIVQMVIDAKRNVLSRIFPEAYPRMIHKTKWHRLFFGAIGVYGICWAIVNRVQYSQIPDRRFLYVSCGDLDVCEVDPVKAEDVNKYIEEKYLHRTSGHHH